jgi:predicted O-methyltransferase YrrM
VTVDERAAAWEGDAGERAPDVAASSTYEEIIDRVVGVLLSRGALRAGPPTPWDSFLRLSDLVHERFEIPSTTITPILRRLLFALGFAARARSVVGVGTFVGYAFAWLLRDRSDPRSAPFLDAALGLDANPSWTRTAETNCRLLGHGARLRFAAADGTVAAAYPSAPIDLLYLDLDDPCERKAGYARALEAASPRLAQGALILAHDPCVPMFEQDFAIYHELLSSSGRFLGPWVLPVDECGLSVAAAT